MSVLKLDVIVSISMSSRCHKCRATVAPTTTNSRNALFLNAGTSRYVFTTDVSVNEVQAFIRDLVLVLGWFGPLDRYGR